jgi:tRNA-dihydrouridine synthase B
MWKIANKTIQGKTILAPLAGVGDSVFRRINRRYGAGLIYTEFISALGLLHKNKKTFKMIDLAEEESPVTIQLFGREPEDLAEACKYIEQTGADFVDLNCGCPEPKIVKSGAGSALLSDPDRIARIVSAMVKSVAIPVTVKIRMGLTQDKPIYLKLAKMVEDAGASALAINCCFASQQKKGPYQREILNELVNELNIPVIGNGGIDTPEDAVEVMKTGVSAVMIGRASLGNPWIFREINSALDGLPIPARPSIDERFSVMADHLKEEVKLLGDYFGVAAMRKHWAWYVKGLPGASSFRGQAVRAGTISEMLGLLEEYRDYLASKK